MTFWVSARAPLTLRSRRHTTSWPSSIIQTQTRSAPCQGCLHACIQHPAVLLAAAGLTSCGLCRHCTDVPASQSGSITQTRARESRWLGLPGGSCMDTRGGPSDIRSSLGACQSWAGLLRQSASTPCRRGALEASCCVGGWGRLLTSAICCLSQELKATPVADWSSPQLEQPRKMPHSTCIAWTHAETRH